MEKRRVVVTGLGTINPIGNNIEETWEAVKAGKCGVNMLQAFDIPDFPIKVAAEVKCDTVDEQIGVKEAKRMDRYTKLALIAAKEAVEDSGIDIEKEDAYRCGVIVSSGIGGLATIEEEQCRGMDRGFEKVSPFFIPSCISNMAAGRIAINHGFKGIATSIVTACASSNNAIGEAFHRIRDGYEEVMLCGGAESTVTPLAVGGFASMKALNKTDDPSRASIPFDAERAGFVLGEGSGILIIEELEHAKARGAKIYFEIVGYGANCDAYHITAPNPEGDAAAKCMEIAVKDAGILPTDIDYINAHGTSTHLNDDCETKAIKKAFGDHAYKLMVSSTKSMTGHLLGGAGAVEAIISGLGLKNSFVPPTIGYKTPDPELDLDYVPNEGRNCDIKYALSNALGFGGHNACVVMKKYEEA